MKSISVGLVVLAVSGCASNVMGPSTCDRGDLDCNRKEAARLQRISPIQSGNERESMRQAAQANVVTYCQRLMADKALDPIRSKVVLTGDLQPTFDMLANTDRVTSEERPAVREWASLTMRCQEQARFYVQSYSTALHVNLYNTVADSGNALKAQLYNGQLTYGQYNQERQKLGADYKAAVQRLNAELARQDAEANYRAQQIANQQWQNYLILQQTVQQQQRAYQQQWQQQHGQITCQQIGQFTYCNY